MFDALSSLLEGRNINRKITLRNHLKSVRAQKSETMQSYFYKSSSNQGAIGSYWWHGWRSRSCNGHLEWSSKRLDILYPRNLFKKETHQVSKVMGRMCSRRRKNSNQRRKAKWQWGSSLDNSYQRLFKRKNYDHPPKKVQGFKKNKKFKKDLLGYEFFTCHRMGHISINCPMRE